MIDQENKSISDMTSNRIFSIVLLIVCAYGFFPFGLENESIVFIVKIASLLAFLLFISRLFSQPGEHEEDEYSDEVILRNEDRDPVGSDVISVSEKECLSRYDFSEILKLIFLSINSVVEDVSIMLFLINKDSNELILQEFSGLRKFEKDRRAFKLSDDLLGKILNSRSLIRIDELNAASDSLCYITGSSDEAKSFLGLPILDEGESIGILAIDSAKTNVFGPKEENLASIYSDLIMHVIRQDIIVKKSAGEIVEAGEKDFRILDQIFEFSKNLGILKSENEIYDFVINSVKNLITYDRVSISAKLDENSGKIILAGGISDDNSPGFEFLLKEGVHGRVIEKEKPYYIPDLDKGEFFIPRYSAVEKSTFGIRSFLGVPLKGGGRCFGSLCVESRGKNGFSENSQKILFLLADYCGYKLNHVYIKNEHDQVSKTDSLTALPNYRSFLDKMRLEAGRAKRYNAHFSILIVDIDNYKTLKETFGSEAGDFVLKEIGRVLIEEIRDVDFIARYGETEFSAIIAHTLKNEALYLGERIKDLVRDRIFNYKGNDIKVSISVGISEYRDYDDKTEEEMISNACKALKSAHENGGNNVIIYSN